MALAVFMPNQNLTGLDSGRKPARAAKGATFFNRPPEPPERYVFQPPFTAERINVDRDIREVNDPVGHVRITGVASAAQVRPRHVRRGRTVAELVHDGGDVDEVGLTTAAKYLLDVAPLAGCDR